MRLTLLSNSATHGEPYLSHALDAIQDLVGPGPLAFVPFALADTRAYVERVTAALTPLGIEVAEVPKSRSGAIDVIEGCSSIFVGGGNTFRLLRDLQNSNLLDEIRANVASGKLSYLGSSAGTNVASPSIRTTNDMPIVEPRSLNALGLIPFQINPHFVDADPKSAHMGETREQRIIEFLEENNCVVVGLREGAWLEVRGSAITLRGMNGAKLFKRGSPATELLTGDDLSGLRDLEAQFDDRVSEIEP